jgi:hypothetical protein
VLLAHRIATQKSRNGRLEPPKTSANGGQAGSRTDLASFPIIRPVPDPPRATVFGLEKMHSAGSRSGPAGLGMSRSSLANGAWTSRVSRRYHAPPQRILALASETCPNWRFSPPALLQSARGVDVLGREAQASSGLRASPVRIREENAFVLTTALLNNGTFNSCCQRRNGKQPNSSAPPARPLTPCTASVPAL